MRATFRKQNEKERKLREKWEIEIQKQANGNIGVCWLTLCADMIFVNMLYKNILPQFEALKRN